MPQCDVPDERLIAYLDSYLSEPVQRSLAAHLPTCPACRARVEAFREVDRILRSAPPPVDVVGVRAAVRARLDADAGRPKRRWPPRRILAAVASLLALIAVVPVTTEADFRLERFLRFGLFEGRRSEEAGDQVNLLDRLNSEPPVVGEPAFQAIEPVRLPLGLERTRRSVPEPTRLEVTYVSPRGITLLLTELPAAPETVVLRPSERQRVVRVRETHVVVLLDPRPDAVAGLIWEQDGVVFTLLVMQSPAGGLPLADAVRVVEALIGEQAAG